MSGRIIARVRAQLPAQARRRTNDASVSDYFAGRARKHLRPASRGGGLHGGSQSETNEKKTC
ncbi:hypothetical protein GCM10008024_24330 [Allgaiera indica]|uniref:Uncharacterized protein n=1 Tax=Allgaiera indica TaxID=765699 RepID=A0AAN4USJ7_9RHOB|nr:hypothetical protein GCM10008024_24330 [Allgaiera indica]